VGHLVNSEIKYKINKDKCINCGLCVDICLVYEKISSKVDTIHPNLCIECGHCESVCPVNAIEGPEEVKMICEDEQIPTYESLQFLLQTRRSIRRYKSEPISDIDLQKMLEAGRYAPTGSNEQNIKYVVINSHEKMQELSEIALPVVFKTFKVAKKIASLPFAGKILGKKQAYRLKNIYGPAITIFEERNKQGEDRLFYNAPGLMVVHGEKQDEALAFSCHIAMHNCVLIAQTLGIGCLLNSFALMAINQSKVLRKKLGIPKENKCFGAMTFGYKNINYKKHVNRKPVNVNIIE
jgi:nitroreductase/NAD-dependent dihydropyrimidine dehydrogenase PreA subunit